MNKYIPADKLIAEIERMISVCETQRADAIEVGCNELADDASARMGELNVVLETITSLQQEPPALPGIEEPGIPGKDFIPVEWVDACEMYGKWKIVKQEQPEVDLDKLVNEEFASHSRTTEYGLEATYNRAELYQLIKKMALLFNVRKEQIKC